MAAQKRSAKRNYIDLVEEACDDQRSVQVPPASNRPIKDYLLSLVTAVRSARSEAR